MNYQIIEYGFWKQIDPEPFQYSLQYKQIQQTTSEMVHLRMGVLLSFFPYDEIINWKVVDVGSGNGNFKKYTDKIFKEIKEYDLTGETISEEELLGTVWDLVVLTDVLEHYPEITDIFKISWKCLFLTTPETPAVDNWTELQSWRHFKPNEHIYMLNGEGLTNFFLDNGCDVLFMSSPEDMIRTRWDNTKPNTTTMIISRN